MKQLIKHIGIAAMCGLGLFSCQLQDDLFGKKTEKEELGTLALSVIANAPASMSTKAEGTVDTKDFQVVIIGEEKNDGTTFSRTYDKVSEMPETIALSVGKYTVRSNTAGKLEKRMTHPYYAGNTELSITKNVTSEANVKCTMQNSRIQIQYSDEFKSAFKSWTVTMDDGTDSALSFDQTTDANTPIYWTFEEGVSQVRLNIRAVTQEGNTITDSRTFLKSMVSEGYGDVNNSENFVGGDALVLDFKPSTTDQLAGNVQGINVSVLITFAEHKEQVQIPVSDKEEPETPTTPTEPETPTTGEPSITLPADFSFSASNEDSKPASADAILKTPAGLKSAIVKIETSSAEFTKTLQDATFDTAGALLTGAELIGNQAMQGTFDTLGLTESDSDTPKKTPEAGVKEYIFPISAFFNFLQAFPGTHKFQLTLTDVNNKQVSKTLTITVTE